MEQAVQEDARQQIRAVEAASYPWLEESARMKMLSDLRMAMLAPGERQAQTIDANWGTLRKARGLH